MNLNNQLSHRRGIYAEPMHSKLANANLYVWSLAFMQIASNHTPSQWKTLHADFSCATRSKSGPFIRLASIGINSDNRVVGIQGLCTVRDRCLLRHPSSFSSVCFVKVAVGPKWSPRMPTSESADLFRKVLP